MPASCQLDFQTVASPKAQVSATQGQNGMHEKIIGICQGQDESEKRVAGEWLWYKDWGCLLQIMLKKEKRGGRQGEGSFCTDE